MSESSGGRAGARGCRMLYSGGDSDGPSGWQLLFPCVMLPRGGV